MREICKTQRDAPWFAARVGKVTGSNVSRALAYLKRASNGRKAGESSKERDTYKLELISEILTGQPVEHYVSPYMDEGRENEPLARARYMLETQEDVTLTGFVLHPTMDRFGASPDGYTDPGVIELKCPQAKTHLAYMQGGVIPDEYIDQVDAEILCCEKEWADFVSFCPFILDRNLQYFAVRRYRDEQRFREIEAGVVQFLEEVHEAIGRLRNPQSKLAEQLAQSLEVA